MYYMYMYFKLKFQQCMLVWVCDQGVTGRNFQIKMYFCSWSLFILENSVDTDEMPQNLRHFIWVFTVYQSI